MTNSCDKFRIKNCSSQGNATASFQVDTGCTNGVIYGFSGDIDIFAIYYLGVILSLGFYSILYYKETK